MSAQSEVDPLKNQSNPLTWYHIWLMVLIQPRSRTFEKVVKQTPVSFRRAYDWAFIGNWGFPTMIFTFMDVFAQEKANSPFVLTPMSTVLSKIIAIVFFALFLLIGFLLLGTLTQMISRLFGGKGAREQMIYAIASYLAPLGLVIGLLSVIPLFRYAVFGLVIYGIILNTVATKTVHQFGWARATIINFIIFFPPSICAVSTHLDLLNTYEIYQWVG